MKKAISFFAALVICFSLLSPIGQVFATKEADSLTVLDLIRLKKHIVGNFEHNDEFDYNADKIVDALDLVALRRILLSMPFEPAQPDNNGPTVGDDGFYEDIYKP